MRIARQVELNSEDRAVLQQQARGRSLAARLVERSRIVLRAADGLQNDEIAAEFGIMRIPGQGEQDSGVNAKTIPG